MSSVHTMGFQKAFDIPNPESGEPTIVYMYAGRNQFIELFYGTEKRNSDEVANAEFYHLCVQVDDIIEAWQRILDSGVPRDDAPKMVNDGNWQCRMRDPDGVKIELMQLGEDGLHMNYLKSISE